MTWTDDPPAARGWYWWRRTPHSPEFIVEVVFAKNHDGRVEPLRRVGLHTGYQPTDLAGQWSDGPVPRPLSRTAARRRGRTAPN